MRIGQKEFSEPELRAHIKELEYLLATAAKEIDKLGYEDCFGCVHKGACAFADDCHYRWELADRVERILAHE